MSVPFLFDLVAPLAQKLGFRFLHDPGLEARDAAKLVYPDGTVRFLLKHWFDLNPAGAADMARVKAWSLHFLRQSGFPVPEFDYFFENRWAQKHLTGKNEAAAAEYAARLGYPLVVKPSCMSFGKGVHIVPGPEALPETIRMVAAIDPMFVVQRLARGTEYRVVVFDGEVRLAYRKAPFKVAGDGERTIQDLVLERVAELRAGATHAELDPDDPRIDSYLVSLGLSRETVPAPGERVQIGLTANYRSGGQLSEALHLLPASIARAAVAIARCAGLRLTGLDVLVEEDQGGDPPYHVIEVNGSPMFEGYAGLGPEQRERVVAMVEDILLAMQPTPAASGPRPASVSGTDRLMKRPFLLDLVTGIASRHGIGLDVEPEFQHAAQLVYPGGTVRYVREWILDVNRATASTLARSRAWSLQFLRDAGFPVLEFRSFVVKSERRSGVIADWAASRYASTLGYPVVIKPSIQARGEGVHFVASQREMRRIRKSVVQLDRSFMVQRWISGVQLGVVVFDGAVRMAYASAPLTVEGDGTRTVQALLDDRFREAAREGAALRIEPADPRIDAFLLYRGLTRFAILREGETVQAAIYGGPAYGGRMAEATAAVPPDLCDAAVAAAHEAGLRFCRIDFMLVPEDAPAGSPWFLLEVDPFPDLEEFAGLGPVQHDAVTGLVEEIVVAMGRSAPLRTLAEPQPAGKNPADLTGL